MNRMIFAFFAGLVVLLAPAAGAGRHRDKRLYSYGDDEQPFLFKDRAFDLLFELDIGDWHVRYLEDEESRIRHVVVHNLLEAGHYLDETAEADPLNDFIEVPQGTNFDQSNSQAVKLARNYLKSKDWIDTGQEDREWFAWQRRFSEREILVAFFHDVRANETDVLALTDGGNWLSGSAVCKWVGISCGALPTKALLHSPSSFEADGQEIKVLEPSFDRPPEDAVTAIQLPSLGLKGTIPAVLGRLKYLQKLRLDYNRLQSTIPPELAEATSLRYMDLSNNLLEGSIPESFGEELTSLQLLSIHKNYLTGTIPILHRSGWAHSLQRLDLSFNGLTGTIPRQIEEFTSLQILALDNNLLTGGLPDFGRMTRLKELDLGSNALTGSLPSSMKNCLQLQQLVLGDNVLTGTLPSELFEMPNLRALMLSNNQFYGELDLSRARDDLNLGLLAISDNQFSSTIPTGIGILTNLNVLLAAGNKFVGRIPSEISQLKATLVLNLTNNFLTGEVPSVFCGQSPDHGCDAILCPREEAVLGRVSCEGYTDVYGDLDGDGVVSQREVLRLLFVHTIGRLWGAAFQDWFNMDMDECGLKGIVCVRGAVAKIDLTEAVLCSNAKSKKTIEEECLGLPTELGLLSGLEILQLSLQRYLQGTIPTELGLLTRLRHLDVSGTLMSSTIPTEMGQLTSLIHFLASFANFVGKLPTELFLLTRLEKLHLTDNELTGTFPERIELSSVRELMISRNEISGSISSEIGHMAKLENFEVYSNQLVGTLPREFAMCINLKRMDFFNNQITGSIPAELSRMANLQIFHAKQNLITGTIPSEIGLLPELSWFDVSNNFLHGTIPATFGESTSIENFRVGDNMLHEPVPESFCHNEALNDGATIPYGCDGVVCPLDSYTEAGFAMESAGGCIPCPEGQSTVYVGSTGCRTFDERDILTIMHAVMEGITWPSGYDETWTKENPNDVCDWSGIECSESGEILSLSIPLP